MNSCLRSSTGPIERIARFTSTSDHIDDRDESEHGIKWHDEMNLGLDVQVDLCRKNYAMVVYLWQEQMIKLSLCWRDSNQNAY